MSAPLVVVADPPWQFLDKLPGKGRGAVKHYACMSVRDIALHVGAATIDADDVVLFMWRIASMQVEAIDVIDACSLKIKSELVWEKLTSTGKAHFGMGRYVRASHETCLIATRGKAQPVVRNQRSRFSAPVREHSRKPEFFYDIVERMYPHSKKVELFARTVRRGWTQHGDQLGKFEAVG